MEDLDLDFTLPGCADIELKVSKVDMFSAGSI